MKRFWFILAGIIMLAGASASIWLWKQNQSQSQTQTPAQTESSQQSQTPATIPSASPETTPQTQLTDKFIVKNPVDLSAIEKISKFRSCSGHDFSGLNIFGQKESNRSMKHYFAVKESLKGTNKAKIYAPFDAVIESVEYVSEFKDYDVELAGPAAGSWHFFFQHVILKPGLKQGSVVKAGEEMGYGHVPGNSQSFDIALKRFGPDDKDREQFESQVLAKIVYEGKTREEAEREVINSYKLQGPPPQGAEEEDREPRESEEETMTFDSIFYHMTPAVLAEFNAKGVSLDNIIISKDYRDAHPCNFNITYDRPEDWVVLKQ